MEVIVRCFKYFAFNAKIFLLLFILIKQLEWSFNHTLWRKSSTALYFTSASSAQAMGSGLLCGKPLMMSPEKAKAGNLTREGACTRAYPSKRFGLGVYHTLNAPMHTKLRQRLSTELSDWRPCSSQDRFSIVMQRRGVKPLAFSTMESKQRDVKGLVRGKKRQPSFFKSEDESDNVYSVRHGGLSSKKTDFVCESRKSGVLIEDPRESLLSARFSKMSRGGVLAHLEAQRTKELRDEAASQRRKFWRRAALGEDRAATHSCHDEGFLCVGEDTVINPAAADSSSLSKFLLLPAHNCHDKQRNVGKTVPASLVSLNNVDSYCSENSKMMNLTHTALAQKNASTHQENSRGSFAAASDNIRVFIATESQFPRFEYSQTLLLPLDTSVRQLKERIKAEFPSHPPPSVQVLRLGSRVLEDEDEETLASLANIEGVSPASSSELNENVGKGPKLKGDSSAFPSDSNLAASSTYSDDKFSASLHEIAEDSSSCKVTSEPHASASLSVLPLRLSIPLPLVEKLTEEERKQFISSKRDEKIRYLADFFTILKFFSRFYQEEGVAQDKRIESDATTDSLKRGRESFILSGEKTTESKRSEDKRLAEKNTAEDYLSFLDRLRTSSKASLNDAAFFEEVFAQINAERDPDLLAEEIQRVRGFLSSVFMLFCEDKDGKEAEEDELRIEGGYYTESLAKDGAYHQFVKRLSGKKSCGNRVFLSNLSAVDIGKTKEANEDANEDEANAANDEDEDVSRDLFEPFVSLKSPYLMVRIVDFIRFHLRIDWLQSMKLSLLLLYLSFNISADSSVKKTLALMIPFIFAYQSRPFRLLRKGLWHALPSSSKLVRETATLLPAPYQVFLTFDDQRYLQELYAANPEVLEKLISRNSITAA